MSLWGTYLEELLDVSFNDVSLQSVTGGQITGHNFEEFPEIRSAQNPVSSAHRSITTGRYFIAKHATINIAVEGELHDLQAILSRLKQLIQYTNKDLVLKRGVPKLVDGEYVLNDTDDITFRAANVVAVDMGDTMAKGKVISIEFTIDDPVGIGSTEQVLLNSSGVTTNMTTIDLTTVDLQGTFFRQYPVFEFTINSVTNEESSTIQIKNGFNQITISQPFKTDDMLVVDTDEMKVFLNDELIDFDGALPVIFDRGSVIYISDTFEARDMDIKVSTKPRYI